MTEQEFSQWWKLLCERFNREPSAPMTRIYAVYVRSQNVTAAEWAEAVQQAVIFEKFFPEPAHLVNLGRGGKDFEARALAEWDACMTRMMAGEAATLPNTLTRKLMNASTNHTPLSEIPTNRLHHIQRDFLKRYADALKDEQKSNMPALLPTSKREALPDAS